MTFNDYVALGHHGMSAYSAYYDDFWNTKPYMSLYMSITLCIYVGTCNVAMRFYPFTQAPEHIAHGAKLTKLHDLCMAVSVSEVVAFQHDPTTPNLAVGSYPNNHMMLC